MYLKKKKKKGLVVESVVIGSGVFIVDCSDPIRVRCSLGDPRRVGLVRESGGCHRVRRGCRRGLRGETCAQSHCLRNNL